MTHDEAVSIHAAEAYLLGDLPAAQHDAFEEHFADCEACFTDVKSGATLIATLKRKPDIRFLPVPRLPLWACLAAIVLAVALLWAFSTIR